MTIELADLRRAAAAIDGVAERTPVLHHPAFDPPDGVAFHKIEALQRSGSFKFRGAYHRLSNIPDADRARGVVAVSSGNHGAVVARAAELLGIDATVYIPADTPTAKRALIEAPDASIRARLAVGVSAGMYTVASMPSSSAARATAAP